MKYIVITIQENEDKLIETTIDNLSREDATNMEQKISEVVESMTYRLFEGLSHPGSFKIVGDALGKIKKIIDEEAK
jgi:hypothetical protein